MLGCVPFAYNMKVSRNYLSTLFIIFSHGFKGKRNNRQFFSALVLILRTV